MFTNRYGNHVVVVRFDRSQPLSLAQTEQPFDCFVLNTLESLRAEDVSKIASAIVESECQWAEVFGGDAERIHDAIDNAAVTCGRQVGVGDGNPMTTWNEEPVSIEQFGAYICAGGQGDCDLKVVLIVGDDDAERRLSAILRSQCVK